MELAGHTPQAAHSGDPLEGVRKVCMSSAYLRIQAFLPTDLVCYRHLSECHLRGLVEGKPN